jgi:hypothetical protein
MPTTVCSKSLRNAKASRLNPYDDMPVGRDFRIFVKSRRDRS